MPPPIEARIIVKHGRRLDLRVGLTVYSPHDGKEVDTGLAAGPSQADIDRTILGLKETLERAGNRVSVVELRN